MSPSFIEKSPMYILNGRSEAYLNGIKFSIFCKTSGIRGTGITPPESKVHTDTTSANTPFASSVYKIAIYANIFISDISTSPSSSEIKNSKNAPRLIGKLSL